MPTCHLAQPALLHLPSLPGAASALLHLLFLTFGFSTGTPFSGQELPQLRAVSMPVCCLHKASMLLMCTTSENARFSTDLELDNASLPGQQMHTRHRKHPKISGCVSSLDRLTIGQAHRLLSRIYIADLSYCGQQGPLSKSP
jgi:hypothetical protein